MVRRPDAGTWSCPAASRAARPRRAIRCGVRVAEAPRRHREAELVVLAAGERRSEWILAPLRARAVSGRERNLGEAEAGPDAAGAAEVADVLEEAGGDVDAGGGEAA